MQCEKVETSSRGLIWVATVWFRMYIDADFLITAEDKREGKMFSRCFKKARVKTYSVKFLLKNMDEIKTFIVMQG